MEFLLKFSTPPPQLFTFVVYATVDAASELAPVKCKKSKLYRYYIA